MKNGKNENDGNYENGGPDKSDTSHHSHSPPSERLLPPRGDYQTLLSFQEAEVVYLRGLPPVHGNTLAGGCRQHRDLPDSPDQLPDRPATPPPGAGVSPTGRPTRTHDPRPSRLSKCKPTAPTISPLTPCFPSFPSFPPPPFGCPRPHYSSAPRTTPTLTRRPSRSTVTTVSSPGWRRSTADSRSSADLTGSPSSARIRSA